MLRSAPVQVKKREMLNARRRGTRRGRGPTPHLEAQTVRAEGRDRPEGERDADDECGLEAFARADQEVSKYGVTFRLVRNAF